MSTANNAPPAPALYDDPCARAERGGSLFLRIARFCQQQTLTLQEMRELIRSNWLKRSCFEMPKGACGRLRRAMAVSEQDWPIVQARELVNGIDAAAFIVGQLRYCPRCLAVGWHSALFQHLAVRYCPQHGVRLVTGCLRCGAAIDTSPATVVEHHLFCPDCGAPLVGREIGPLQTHVERFAAVREALRPPTRARVVSWPAGYRADQVLQSAAQCNAIAIHSVRSSACVRGLRCFQLVTIPLPGVVTDSPERAMRRYEFAHTVNAVHLLMGLVSSACGHAALRSCARLVQQFRVSECDEMLIPVVAFWQTALALNMPKSLGEGHLEFYTRWIHPTASWLPDRPEVLQPAIQAHALALFTANLMKARKYRTVRDICWTYASMPDAPEVMPAWWIEGCGVSASWVLQSRIDAASVCRLIRRYRHQAVQP